MVFAGALVQPDAVIGDHVIVNTGATIDHDRIVDDCAHLAPGVHLAGSVQVGEGAFLGIGSVRVQASGSGAGRHSERERWQFRDLLDGVVAAGVPARPLER